MLQTAEVPRARKASEPLIEVIEVIQVIQRRGTTNYGLALAAETEVLGEKPVLVAL